jgi:murein DD-endopeptidase MepM/ murein hydrolase activator NlpD
MSELTKNKYNYPIKKENIIKIDNSSPAHKGRLKHSVDFIILEGTPINAALKGIVVDVKQDSNLGGSDKSFDKSGNYIEIQHENGEYSIYEHIKQNGSLVKKGDRVKTGQIIGYSGATGWIAHLGPHLHFDVHKYVSLTKYKTLKINWDKE